MKNCYTVHLFVFVCLSLYGWLGFIPARTAAACDGLSLYPADAYRWASCAEERSIGHDSQQTADALDRAVTLAPNVPQIIMRRMNYCFGRRDSECVLSDGHAILKLDNMYDDIIFAYYRLLDVAVDRTLRDGIPNAALPLRSYIRNAARVDGDQSRIERAWLKASGTGSVDDATQAAVVSILVDRRMHELAGRIWRDGGERSNEVISNPLFRGPFKAVPFDWSLPRAVPGLGVELNEGLTLRFDGSQNLRLDGPSQYFIASPGPHRLRVEFESAGLTTDELPYFHVFDVDHPARLAVRSDYFPRRSSTAELTLDFTVPPTKPLLLLRLERQPSQKFDNKLAGVLKVRRVSIRHTGSTAKPGA